MKQVSKQERDLNILTEAIKNGFVINQTESFEENCNEAELFLICESDKNLIQQEIVKLIGDTFIYTDRMGYTIEVSGDHSDFMYVVNSFGQVIELFIEK